MPPVLGPVSPSPMRLKSCAAASGRAASPWQSASSETSSPTSNSSMTTVAPASPKAPPTRQASTAAMAAARSGHTATPLPAASPSALTTHAPPRSSTARRADSTSVHVMARAVGTPAACISSFENAFEPSTRAAPADGPKTAMRARRRASPRPSTSGSSGPTTTSPTSRWWASATRPPTSSTATSWQVATRAMPGLPGAQCSSRQVGLAASACASACSRPPEPTSRILIAPSLVAAPSIPTQRLPTRSKTMLLGVRA